MNLTYFLLIIVLTEFAAFSKHNEKPVDQTEWFTFNPADDFSPSVIDCYDWLDAPAGKHGIVKMDGHKFVFADGTPVKFWGVNICSNEPYTDSTRAKAWTIYLAKYGVNSVRFHKFTANALKGDNSTVISPEKFAAFDFFNQSLRNQGIYYGWSPIYGHKPKAGDKSKLLAYDEIAKADMGNHLSFSTIGLVNFAEDLQDLHIELIVNMLNHKNERTGLRYADDPALIFVELQNEDNIWFATCDQMLDKCPTYKQLLTKKFTKWLRDKYGNQGNLAKAWGADAFVWGREVRKTNWNLDSNNICPVANHGIYDYEYKKALEAGKPVPKFLSDMALFLFDEQSKFYDRFVAAIRKTGYKGPVVGSCWQAGSGLTHYYNLYADYKAGIIDRHNYSGGGTGHSFKTGNVENTPMISHPGSELLSTGFQAVADRPFAISEWMNLIANEWVAEGVPLIAAYGMGLQGWASSFAFASNDTKLSPTLQSVQHGVYNVDAITHIGLYPAISRMIYRGDVTEGKLIANRTVYVTGMADGKLGINEKIVQDGDKKQIVSDLPQEAIAIGRVAFRFTDKPENNGDTDLSQWWDKVNKVVKSTTGQLIWDYSDKGFVTINTPGTQGVVGFTSSKLCELADVSIKVETPFAIVLVSSLDKATPIKSAKNLLITTIARAKNTSMKYSDDMKQLIEPGTAPLLLEPVNVTVALKSEANPKVFVLDHSGKRTSTTVKNQNNSFVLDGNTYKTMYYEVVF